MCWGISDPLTRLGILSFFVESPLLKILESVDQILIIDVKCLVHSCFFLDEEHCKIQVPSITLTCLCIASMDCSQVVTKLPLQCTVLMHLGLNGGSHVELSSKTCWKVSP